jgi:preprotein translocase subunit SecA
VDRKLDLHCPAADYPEHWDLTGLQAALIKTFLLDTRIKPEEIPQLVRPEFRENILRRAMEIYEFKERTLTPEVMRQLERFAFLRVIDERWKEHLNVMDELKTGIGMRAYGQRDPLIEYKKEGFGLFEDLLNRMDEETVELVYKLQVSRPREEEERRRRLAERMQTQHADAVGLAARMAGAPAEEAAAEGVGPGKASRQLAEVAAASRGEKRAPVVREMPKVGRNDACPCGSGKKYKKCHGAGA